MPRSATRPPRQWWRQGVRGSYYGAHVDERVGPQRPDLVAKATRKTRDDTKQAQLIAMLRRKERATIARIVEATGWQPHTVRGAFAGALKKKLGLTVTSEKVEGTRVYRIVA